MPSLSRTALLSLGVAQLLSPFLPRSSRLIPNYHDCPGTETWKKMGRRGCCCRDGGRKPSTRSAAVRYLAITVQFYKATSNGVVSDKDLAEIAAQINRVYKEADYVGSLVVQGDTGRPTEHAGPKFELPGWWDDFWKRHYANTGQTQEEAVKMLNDLLGHDWSDRTVGEVEQAMQKKRQSAG